MREIHNSLVKKGFRCEVGGSHQKYHLVVDEKDTGIVTLLSRSFDEYSDALLGRVARQLRLSRQEFTDLVTCKLEGTSYVSLLRERGLL